MNDRFEAEGVTLILGDCREVLPSLSGIDSIITDPPFGIGFAAQPTKWQRMDGIKPEAWDDETCDFVLSFPSRAEIVVVWGGNYYSLPISRGWLSWFKPDAPPSMGSIELAWTNLDQNSRQISWSISATNAERVGHPTQKPYRVMAWTMEQAHVPESALVCDPYMGSGTTGIACMRTGRRFIGIERDPKHFQTAVDRVKRELSQLKFAF
jgi:site-specific DNA-methyltransferase (adenine-specific)